MGDVAAAYTCEFILSALPEGAERILEVGCGSGELAEMLMAEGLSVVALDSDPECVTAARARGVDARQARWPDFSDSRFDAVLFTRSLHHVEDLRGSLDAAFDCGGAVIVEDFAYHEAAEPTLQWFRSIAGLLERCAQFVADTDFIAELLSSRARVEDWWHASHDHHLHSAAEMEAELRALAMVDTADAAYYFRYLSPAVGMDAAALEAMLRHELEMIGLGLIRPLGRRYVATRQGS